MTSAAQAVVVAFALTLLAFSGTAAVRPAAAIRLLESFASSARAHYLEQGLRIAAGLALVVAAPAMAASGFFRLLGWTLIVTSAALLGVPWRRHQQFARRVLPPVVRHLKPYAVLVAAFAVLLIYGVIADGRSRS